MKRWMLAVVGVLAAVLLINAILQASAGPILITNVRLITMNPEQPIASAMLIDGDRIVAIGELAELEAQAEGAERVDMQGNTLMPGFIDAHGHFPGSGLTELVVDLNSPPIGRIESISDLQQAMQAQLAEASEDGWLVGMGYDDSLLLEKRHPHRSELDAISSDVPIFIMHVSGHMGVANSLARERLNITADTPDPEGGHIEKDANGELTGLLEENAANPAQMKALDLGLLDFLKMARFASDQYLSRGVTLAQSGGLDGRMATGLSWMRRFGQVKTRLELWPMSDSLGQALLENENSVDKFEAEGVNIGAIKFVTDGSIQGFTGFLAHPYHTPFKGDADYRGYPRIPFEPLRADMLSFHKQGYQLALHGNGDAAIESIINAWEWVQSQHFREDARPIIIHAQMARVDQLERMAELGMTPSFFSAHTFYWGDRHRDIFMGPERAAGMSPAASAAQLGLRFTIHCDTPVVPMDPLFLAWTAVNRRTSSGQLIGPDERIPVERALRAITLDAAWQIGREQDLGSLEAGKLADFVVLGQNPLAVDPARLHEVPVLATWVGGEAVYQREQP